MQSDSTTEITKRCRGCDIVKPYSEFWKRTNRKSGVMARCKECQSLYHGSFIQKRKAAYIGPTVSSKQCSRCGLNKPAAEFTKKVSSSDGLDVACILCKKILNAHFHKLRGDTKNRDRWRCYRLKPEDFQLILDSQYGKCAICRDEMTVVTVDHCHQTGRIRGILCTWCNAMLAGVECNGFIERANKYLKSTCIVESYTPEYLIAGKSANGKVKHPKVMK